MKKCKYNWYDKIEKPVRPLVKLLRDNGYNTTCSCGHEMYIECDYHFESILDLYNLLHNNGYAEFKIEIIVGKNKQYGSFKILIIWLLMANGKFSRRSADV